MSQDNIRNTTTTDSFEIMEEGIKSRMIGNRLRKIISSILFSIVSIFMVLFFSLPVFQAKGMKIDGLVNFSKEDVLQLSDLNGYKPNLFLSKEKASDALLKNANGLILKADFQNNGLLSSCTILEDYPVCSFSDISYFSSGLTLKEGISKVDSLSLSEEGKNNLKKKLSDQGSSLPKIYFPKGVSATKEHIQESATKLSGVSRDSLQYMVGIQFENESEDSNWSNIASLLVLNQDKYYLIKGIQTYHFKDYVLSEYFGKSLFDNFEEAIEKQKVTKKDFSFFGEEQNYSVYEFKALYNDSEKKIRYVC